MERKEQMYSGFVQQTENKAIPAGIGGKGKSDRAERLLLHCCCGPCSTACIERLAGYYDITVFFYNPCITDNEEYEKRKASQIKFINEYNKLLTSSSEIKFIEGQYDTERYFRLAEPFKDEPEGGKRCTVCFNMRLGETARMAEKEGFDIFGTTLTVSPHKNYPLISEIGNKLAEKYRVKFLDMDFKKKAGFERSVKLSKEYGLYRQNYCGCEYSKWWKRR